jgi:hypothetical protein
MIGFVMKLGLVVFLATKLKLRDSSRYTSDFSLIGKRAFPGKCWGISLIDERKISVINKWRISVDGSEALSLKLQNSNGRYLDGHGFRQIWAVRSSQVQMGVDTER